MRGNDEAFIYLLLRLSLVCRAKARPTAYIWLGLLSVGIYPDFLCAFNAKKHSCSGRFFGSKCQKHAKKDQS